MSDRRLPLRKDGVMRCCIATLSDYEGLDGNGHEMNEGTVLSCKYCQSSLIVRDGAWEWNRDADEIMNAPRRQAPSAGETNG